MRRETMQQTKGQYRVGITFNPSQLGVVDQIKVKAAELIDLIDSVPSNPDTPAGATVAGDQLVGLAGERARLKALAQTGVEEAAMWAVKAATKQART
jgi:hypothetical protein